ncbi:MAG: hypothetical protein V1761_01370, partial [bacterium]
LLAILPECIDRFNKEVSCLLKANGVCFAWSDVFQVKIGSSFDIEAHQASTDPAMMDALYDDYFSRYGFGLGDYGLFSLAGRIHEEKHIWLSWPFSDTDRMIVKFVILTKRD